eukprot:7094148-Prymnesium_polylepis.1
MPQPLCDRCDGKHPSTECPHLKWARGKHADARFMPVEERPPALVPTARCVSSSYTIRHL